MKYTSGPWTIAESRQPNGWEILGPLGQPIAMTRHELARINAIFARGKGTWPQPDYIKDDAWNRLLGEQYAFNEVLRWLGVAVSVKRIVKLG